MTRNSAVIVAEHAVQQLVAEGQRAVVIDLMRAPLLRQIDLARLRTCLTVGPEDRKAMPGILTNVPPIDMGAAIPPLKLNELADRYVAHHDAQVVRVELRFDEFFGDEGSFRNRMGE